MTDLKLTGLELREAVAVEVMGLKVDWVGILRPALIRSDTLQLVPRYEEKIQAAWEVVEAMRAKATKLNWFSMRHHPHMGFGVFFEGCPCESEAPTAPEAICLAALAAIRSQA